MKKIILILAVALFSSCFGETEQQKIDNEIMDAMYIKAKMVSPDPYTFKTHGEFYKNMLNDSIAFCQQNYSYENVFGKREQGKVYAYFNTYTGFEVSDYVEFLASENELSKVKYFIK